MALDQDRMAPCHQPKMAALDRVIINAGSGAMREENTIRQKEKAMAQPPKERMYSMTASTLALPSTAAAAFF